MKITDVSVTLFKWENIPTKSYDHEVKIVGTNSDLGLVSITTDEGIEGHALLGLCVHPASLEAPYIIRFLKPILMGQNPLDRERLFQRMQKMRAQVSTQVVCALDIALWDLAGKISGLPIHALMGTFRDKIPVYVIQHTVRLAGSSNGTKPGTKFHLTRASTLILSGVGAFGKPGAVQGPVSSAPYPLALDQAKEALGHRLVVTIPAPTHGVFQVVRLEERRPVHAGELATIFGLSMLKMSGLRSRVIASSRATTQKSEWPLDS